MKVLIILLTITFLPSVFCIFHLQTPVLGNFIYERCNTIGSNAVGAVSLQVPRNLLKPQLRNCLTCYETPLRDGLPETDLDSDPMTKFTSSFARNLFYPSPCSYKTVEGEMFLIKIKTDTKKQKLSLKSKYDANIFPEKKTSQVKAFAENFPCIVLFIARLF